jgi:hypothetical protein
MMEQVMQKIAEIVEASTTEFTAQCYELYQFPPLGALVKTVEGTVEIYGITCNATTSGIEPGRRPVARGKNETTEEGVYSSNPQLTKLLRSEFNALVVGYRQEDKMYHYLPPNPARIHSFVFVCSPEEIRDFSRSFAFLNVLLNTRMPIPIEEVTGSALSQFSQAHEDSRGFLVAAGRELAVILGDDFNRLRIILDRFKR